MIENGGFSYKPILDDEDKPRVFPLCVDNFFDEPDTIREWANSLPKESLKITCVLDELLLAPGTYYLNLAILNKDSLVEFHERFIVFEILSSDYFDTGQLIADLPGYVFLKQKWV